MQGITKKRNGLSMLAVLLACLVAIATAMMIAGCGGSSDGSSNSDSSQDGKTLVYATTDYGVEMENAGLNPHSSYSGWSTVRYGVGETLFKFNDEMEPEPWLATSYEFIDDTHCKITLQEGIYFSSGREMDAQAVKECLDDLIATHDRAPSDTKISSIEASDDGTYIIIETSEPCPALINYLCDPYGAIIDMEYGVTEDDNVSGTGPYIATYVSDTEIDLVANEDYWDGEPQLDSIVVLGFSDGDTLASALQSGEIDACQGLSYSEYELFSDESQYTISTATGSRVFFGEINYESEIMQDEAVRQALTMGIDREGFIETLLEGYGSVASGAFPDSMGIEGETVEYDPEGAAEILEEAGWTDTDGDGIREKDGQELTIRWLTYPGRVELPLLAEYAQSTLGEIGFDVQINSTENHATERNDTSSWDVYVSAKVTATTGDPEYFFTSTCVTGASANYGGYSNSEVDELVAELSTTFDADERTAIAGEIQQILLDDYGYFFVSHLEMGFVSTSDVTNLVPHPSDYYQITVDTSIEEE